MKDGEADSGTVAAAAKRFPVVPVVAAVVGAGVAVGIVGLVWGFGGSGTGSPPSRPSTPGSASGSGKLSAEARQLQRLLVAGNQITYHVTYELTTTNPQAAGETAVVEVWRQPPLERQDTSLTVAGAPAQHAEALNLSSGLVNCSQMGTGPWSCTAVGNALPSGPQAIIRQITQSLGGDTVTERASSVANIPASCFDLANASTKLSVCVNGEGVPMLVTDGTNTVRLTKLDHTVGNGVFTPPAPVKASSTSSSAA